MIAHPFIAFAYAQRALHRVGCGVWEFLVKAVWPAAACTMVMTLAVWGSLVVTRLPTPTLNLALQVAAGAVAYTATAVLFYRTQIAGLIRVARARQL
jgi:hypothetical protein